MKKYGYSTSFRPFKGLQKAWFVKRYEFNTINERWAFVTTLPKWKRKYPFEESFYIYDK